MHRSLVPWPGVFSLRQRRSLSSGSRLIFRPTTTTPRNVTCISKSRCCCFGPSQIWPVKANTNRNSPDGDGSPKQTEKRRTEVHRDSCCTSWTLPIQPEGVAAAGSAGSSSKIFGFDSRRLGRACFKCGDGLLLFLLPIRFFASGAASNALSERLIR